MGGHCTKQRTSIAGGGVGDTKMVSILFRGNCSGGLSGDGDRMEGSERISFEETGGWEMGFKNWGGLISQSRGRGVSRGGHLSRNEREVHT